MFSSNSSGVNKLRYLLITFYKQRNGTVDEQASVRNNLNSNALATANIIFDFRYRKIERCFVDGQVMDKDWDRLDTYYRPIYPKLFEDLDQLNGWESPKLVEDAEFVEVKEGN